MITRADQTLLYKDSISLCFMDAGDPQFDGQVRSADVGGKKERWVYLWFQFPPRVTNDTRKANWKEKTDVAATTEPIVLYASSSPREIGLNFTYIYNNEPRVGGGGKWDANLIQRQLRLVRGYFHRVEDILEQRNLAIWLHLWGIGGAEELTFRMTNIDVKYSETLIWDPSTDPNAKNAFPFKTDVTITLLSWTQGNKVKPKTGVVSSIGSAVSSAVSAVTGDESGTTAQQRLSFLNKFVPRDWY